MAYKRASWHSGLTYRNTCSECKTSVEYTDEILDFRPWYADGFVYCPKCNTPLRHNENLAINSPHFSVVETPAAPAAPAAPVVPVTPVVPVAPVVPVEQEEIAPVVETPVVETPAAGGYVSKFCSQCGNKYEDSDRFCPLCGNKRK